MECEVAREALSARVDGEHEPVPSARVDEHVAGCVECRAWRDAMTGQAARLHRLAANPPLTEVATPRATAVRRGWGWPRWALLVVGGGQLALAAVQGFGLDVGLVHGGMVMSGHLLNESTAWSLALGAIMVVGALRPSAAEGLAAVLSVFAVALAVYVVVDAEHGAVTAARILTHVPVVLGALLAVLVWRRAARPGPAPTQVAGDDQDERIILPHSASRGRRRDHLWPTDGAA
ncbi:zf-HC2 domain-containing protein [Mycolicibacterium madagascariense]|uniref:zf-HC2 domain-containing protein n=1 Tax=Mycolicibacterium madagascariense TaxID=212765 RepID=UPI0013D3A3BE|nr:zf-HC2 domain-containing protein [Mycolicibacterium madagascariense]MCV7014982.1 zf-HC2 domain-containing protein [Mycolicibacterium madagascariense]